MKIRRLKYVMAARFGRPRGLVDATLTAYADWLSACAAVRAAYCRWERALPSDEPLAFASYHAALDREEQAARVYERFMNCAPRIPDISFARP